MSDEIHPLKAAERARWLAELAEAIDAAQSVARQLVDAQGAEGEASALYAELDLARVEVDAMRRGGWASNELELPPLWLQSLLMRQRIGDRLDGSSRD